MLIASKFKRPKAPVELPGKTYFFTPVDPTNADSEHVADVTDPAHIQRLLSISEGYHIAEAQSVPVVSTQPVPTTAGAVLQPGGQGPAPQGDTGATSTGANEQGPLPEEIESAAKELNELSWQGLKAQLAKPGIPRAVVERALAIEKGKPEADQRATTLKILEQALAS